MNDTANPSGRHRSRPVADAVVPVVEERAVVDKRAVQGRTITVTTRPITRTEAITEEVVHQTVSVQRRPVNAVVDEVPAIRQEGDVTIVPVVEERVVVTKELVLVEEVELRRTARSETVEANLELRGTSVEIEE